MKIGTRLILGFLIISIIPITFVGILSINASRADLENEIKNHLETAGRNKVNWINSYFLERKGDIHDLTTSPIVELALDEETFDFEPSVPAQVESRQKYLRDFKEYYDYYDLFLISSSGDVWWTVEEGSDLRTNLESGPYKDTNLADIYREAKNSGGTVISDYEYYAPRNEPVAFIAAPVYVGVDKTLIGVVALQISTKQINEIMQDRTGLGITGETYLVGPDYLMRSDSRFFKESTILKQKVDTENVVNCFEHAKGYEYKETQIFRGYRGTRVLGTYIYLPGMKWCLLAEIDEGEAFSHVTHLKNQILGYILIITVYVGVVGLFFSSSISRPIKKLTKTIEDISMGKLDVQIEGKEREDEIGKLAQAFDRTIVSLKLAMKKVTSSEKKGERS